MRELCVNKLCTFIFFGVLANLAVAKDYTAQDLSPDNERFQHQQADMKEGYLLTTARQPDLTLAEIVEESLTSRNYNKAFYLRQVVQRTDETLPLLLAELNDPGFEQLDIQAQMAVLQDLSVLGDPSAAPSILNITDETEKIINRMAWHTMLYLPPHDAAVQSALVVGAKPELPFYLRRLPAAYLAQNRVKQARPIAEAMLKSDDVEEQAAGIWILGYLGDDVREQAVAILSNKELSHGHESGPLDALADTLGPDEMRAIVPAFKQGGEGWHTAITRATYLHAMAADPGERTVLCYKLVHNDMPVPWDVSLGLKCLLKLDRQDLILREILITGDARGSIILSELQKQGWQLKATDKDVFLEKDQVSDN